MSFEKRRRHPCSGRSEIKSFIFFKWWHRTEENHVEGCRCQAQTHSCYVATLCLSLYAHTLLLGQCDKPGQCMPIWVAICCTQFSSSKWICIFFLDSAALGMQSKGNHYMQFCFVQGIRNTMYTTQFTCPSLWKLTEVPPLLTHVNFQTVCYQIWIKTISKQFSIKV